MYISPRRSLLFYWWLQDSLNCR